MGCLLLGGCLGIGYVSSRGLLAYPTRRLSSFSAGLRKLTPVALDPVQPSAWQVLRNLRCRSFRGFRYRRGLPARGQHTHTNATTVVRVRDAVAAYVRAEA